MSHQKQLILAYLKQYPDFQVMWMRYPVSSISVLNTEEQLETFQIISEKMPGQRKLVASELSSCSLLLQEHHPSFQKRKRKHTRRPPGERKASFSAPQRRAAGEVDDAARAGRSPAARTGRRRTR